MPRLLFLHGGVDEARRVFREEERGYWSSALPLVLEKHGILTVEETTPPELEAALRDEDVAAVLVARMKPSPAALALLRRVLDSTRPALLEGPVAPELHAALGITSAAPIAAEGVVGMASGRFATAARDYGYPGGGRAGPPAVRRVERESRTDWSRLNVPLTAAQAKAWRTIGWDAERWTVAPDTEVIATWTAEDGSPSPAIIRRGNAFATSFSLFALVGQAHTSEPWYHAEYRSSPRSTGFETLLLSIVDALYARARVPRPRVMPWPRNAGFVVNVRHDFDRFLAPEAVAQALARHAQAGSAATWYWRSRHLRASVWQRRWRGNLALKLVARAPNHEVALHTEQLWNGAEAERRTIERIAGQPVAGSCSHGDPTCFRFQGAPNIMWAEEHRLLYTELIQHAHHHPHRFPALDADGAIRPLSVIALPHHESLDPSAQDGQGDVERIVAAGQTFRTARGLLQVMNHPDINQAELFTALGSLPGGGRLDWTAARAANWWRRTHVRDHLMLSHEPAGTVRVRSREAVEGLAVEVLRADGQRHTKLIDLQPDHPVSI